MPINWYPGHMHKARKEARQRLPEVDLVIEVLDARLPWSSTNPMLDELAGHQGANKPRLKILNKADLADPQVTRLWHNYYQQQAQVAVIELSASQDFSHKDSLQKQVIDSAKRLVPGRATAERPLRAMIMGIPNVGKSTTINALKGRSVARTGNEAAVTRSQQRIDLPGHISLIDTPGMLWPKIENESSGYRLALTGAIKDTAFEYEDVALFALDFFLRHYPQTFCEFYAVKQAEIAEVTSRYGCDPETPDEHCLYELMELIGRKRGMLMSGGRVDIARIARQLVMDARSHQLGPVSFETPAMIEMEWQQVLAHREASAARKAARKNKSRR